MQDFGPKFRVVSELQRLGERAFVYKLKKRRPNITDSEIAAEIAGWYLTRAESAPEEGLKRRVPRSGPATEKI